MRSAGRDRHGSSRSNLTRIDPKATKQEDAMTDQTDTLKQEITETFQRIGSNQLYQDHLERRLRALRQKLKDEEAV